MTYDNIEENLKLDLDEIEEEKNLVELISPFRRYFARGIDGSIYAMIFSVVMVFIFRCSMSFYMSNLYNFLTILVIMVFMIFLEPLFLTKFGTTIGKKILGLYVVDENGAYLTYKAGMRRSILMFQHGQGWNIPLYNLYRGWKSYQTYKGGKQLEWDSQSHSTIKLKDKKSWRILVYILTSIALLVSLVIFIIYTLIPLHKGELTVDEFAENYNRYLANIDRSDMDELD